MKRILALVLTCVLILGVCAPVLAATPKYVLPISGIRFPSRNATAFIGNPIQLKPTIQPASRAHEPVVWASSDSDVASVSDSGVITAHRAGIVVISAAVTDSLTEETQVATCILTAKQAPVKSFKISDKEVALSPGDTFSLSASAFLPAYAFDKSITWVSLNQSVATVDAQTGLITAVGVGTARIRAQSHNNKTAVCTVSVTDSVRARSIRLSSTARTVSHQQVFTLASTITPPTAIDEDKVITWVSSNPVIASVDESGVVTAGLINGTALIRATTGNGRSAQCRVTVKTVIAKSVTLDASSITLGVGEKQTLNVGITPSNASNKTATWTSSNPLVAEVANGIVTAKSPGTTVVTASVDGRSARCTVYVSSDKINQVTITATGDITIGGDPRKPASSPASERNYIRLYDLYKGNFLGLVQSVFAGPDEITLINLESNFSTSTKYAKKTYVFRARPAYAEILSRAGIDVVGHANNHANDLGTLGAANTRTAVRNQGMRYVAGGLTTVVEKNGIRVGFCAFNALNRSMVATVRNVVSKLSQTSDIVVVSFHWGKEYSYTTSALQRTHGRAAILAGADLVVGHHAHVVNGIERYMGKSIVYGLGTLSSAILTPKDMDTFIYQQTFKVDMMTRQYQSTDIKLIPISLSSNEVVNDGRPVPLIGSARTRVLNKIRFYSQAFPETLPASAFE